MKVFPAAVDKFSEASPCVGIFMDRIKEKTHHTSYSVATLATIVGISCNFKTFCPSCFDGRMVFDKCNCFF